MTPDERYQEKLRARAEGRVPVIVTAPALPRGMSPQAIEARYIAKMARHGKPSEPAPEATPPAKPEAATQKGGSGKGGKTEQKGEQKPAPEATPPAKS
jgi:hypothetical protein